MIADEDEEEDTDEAVNGRAICCNLFDAKAEEALLLVAPSCTIIVKLSVLVRSMAYYQLSFTNKVSYKNILHIILYLLLFGNLLLSQIFGGDHRIRSVCTVGII